jgi:hypothetical protein
MTNWVCGTASNSHYGMRRVSTSRFIRPDSNLNGIELERTYSGL